ncbi:proteasome regulatory particle base subunit [Boothiomyces macroporosus]|uniref:Proteasome regulatory particle base subunit n=1 Tax=Boothiomyces macroporosus TaxID=261099 RepID=A0AAD5Y4I6_9FUNG|nr:proteasome regulatory particle base subunit [Boothiomyces macroporosus]
MQPIYFLFVLLTSAINVSLKLSHYKESMEKINHALKFPQKQDLKLTSSEKLQLNVDLESFTPHQAVLAVGDKAYVLEKKGSGYTFELNHKNILPSGDYEYSLFIANKNEKLEYPLGVLAIKNSAIKKEDDFHLKKEIFHTFQPEIAEPNPLLSNVFSIATLVPWWGSMGANVRNLTAKSSTALVGSLFLVSLGVSLGLFYTFWLKLNLFQLFGYGAPIWLVTITLGRYALINRSQIKN